MFTFIEKIEGVDFKEALKLLAEKAGVELVEEAPEKSQLANDRKERCWQPLNLPTAAE